jgi:hypothetical protein
MRQLLQGMLPAFDSLPVIVVASGSAVLASAAGPATPAAWTSAAWTSALRAAAARTA